MVKSIFTTLATLAACASFAPASLRAETEQIAGIAHPAFTISPSYDAVGTLFNSGGFVSYTDGTLIGQNGFTLSGGVNTQWTVNSTAGVGGGKGVVATGATTTYAYVTSAYTPAAGELVSCSADIAASAVATTNNFGYLLDVYGNGGSRIGRVGLAYNNGAIVAAVTGRPGGTTGTNGTYVVATGLSANTFYNFELRFNFTLKTFDVYSGGSPIVTGYGFATTSQTGFSDADLQISGVTNATNTGYFDNYLVQVIAVPEPGTVALLAGAGLAGVVFRRRRR